MFGSYWNTGQSFHDSKGVRESEEFCHSRQSCLNYQSFPSRMEYFEKKCLWRFVTFFSWLEKIKRIFSFSIYAICYIVREISEKNEEVWLFLYFSKEWKIRGILSLSTSLACLSYQSLKWIFGKIQLNSKISFLKVLNCSWMKVQYYAITIFAMQSIINSCKITEVSKRTNPIYLEINTITCCQPLLNQYREPH